MNHNNYSNILSYMYNILSITDINLKKFKIFNHIKNTYNSDYKKMNNLYYNAHILCTYFCTSNYTYKLDNVYQLIYVYYITMCYTEFNILIQDFLNNKINTKNLTDNHLNLINWNTLYNIDWNQISSYKYLTQNYILLYKDDLVWEYISKYQKLYIYDIDFYYNNLCDYYINICKHQNCESQYIIKYGNDKISDWSILSIYQDIKYLLYDHTKIQWDKFLIYQNYNDDSIYKYLELSNDAKIFKQYNISCSKMSLIFVKKHINYILWEQFSYFGFINKFEFDKLSLNEWKIISQHSLYYMFIRKFKKYIIWKYIPYLNDITLFMLIDCYGSYNWDYLINYVIKPTMREFDYMGTPFKLYYVNKIPIDKIKYLVNLFKSYTKIQYFIIDHIFIIKYNEYKNNIILLEKHIKNIIIPIKK